MRPSSACVERAIESHRAPAVVAHFDDFCRKALVERDPRARLRAPAGLCERAPEPGAGFLRRQEKDFDEAPLRVATVEPRGPHGDVVPHEEISCAEKLGNLFEPPVLHRSAASIENQQAARPSRPRLLRDPLRGQVVVEEVDAHGSERIAGGLSPTVTGEG